MWKKDLQDKSEFGQMKEGSNEWKIVGQLLSKENDSSDFEV